jgi:hypothetical protein
MDPHTASVRGVRVLGEFRSKVDLRLETGERDMKMKQAIDGTEGENGCKR